MYIKFLYGLNRWIDRQMTIWLDIAELLVTESETISKVKDVYRCTFKLHQVTIIRTQWRDRWKDRWIDVQMER